MKKGVCTQKVCLFVCFVCLFVWLFVFSPQMLYSILCEVYSDVGATITEKVCWDVWSILNLLFDSVF